MVYNPYRQGAATSDAGMSAREIEATAFALVNRALREAATPHERVLALGRNHSLWAIILKGVAADDCALPPALRDDIMRLGLFSLRHSIATMGQHGKGLALLIDINTDMASALRSEPSTVASVRPTGPSTAFARIAPASCTQARVAGLSA